MVSVYHKHVGICHKDARARKHQEMRSPKCLLAFMHPFHPTFACPVLVAYSLGAFLCSFSHIFIRREGPRTSGGFEICPESLSA